VLPLYFIDNNQAFEGTEGCRWFGQAGQALRLLKIKVVQRVRGDKVTGERRFATLTRSKDGDGTAATQGRPDEGDIGLTVNYH
jgi:hypothetical protein